MVRSTKLNKKYSLVRETTSRTASGGIKATSETVLYTDWCEKVNITGQKRMDYGNLQYTDPLKLTVRKRSDFTILTTDIIRIDSKDYQIKSMYELDDTWIMMEVAR